MRMLGHRIREQSALIKADIPRWRADETRHGVAFHIFRHVETEQFEPHLKRQLAGQFGLTDTRGPGKQERAYGLLAGTEPGTCQFDGAHHLRHGGILAEHRHFKIALKFAE